MGGTDTVHHFDAAKSCPSSSRGKDLLERVLSKSVERQVPDYCTCQDVPQLKPDDSENNYCQLYEALP